MLSLPPLPLCRSEPNLPHLALTDLILCSPFFSHKLVQISAEFSTPTGDLTLRATATTVAFPGFLAVMGRDASAVAATAEAAAEEGEGLGEGEQVRWAGDCGFGWS